MGPLTRRPRYFSRHPTSLDEVIGNPLAVPDPFTVPLTTRLYIAFGMRVTGLPGLTAHQWGQWGVDPGPQRSWGYSFHPLGHPRLAVYPAGTSASLLFDGQAPLSFADVLGPITFPIDLWVAADVNLDNGAGGREFTYWCSRTGLDNLQPMGTKTEVGASSFFNSTADFVCTDSSSFCDRFYELELRETPDGPLIIDPDLTHQSWVIGAAFGVAGTPSTWLSRDGVTYTVGGLSELRRSPRPRPYVA